jgi:hypothetical protein
VHVRRIALLILLLALACAGLGLWLGTTIASDTGSIVVVAVTCGVLGSFAPITVRWLAGEARKRDRSVR